MDNSKPEMQASHVSEGGERRRRTPPDPELEQARWDAMVRGIRGGDAGAAQEWVEHHWSAVWLLLRRRMGASATPDLARAALTEAVVEVRGGRLSAPGHLIGWLNRFALRFEPEAVLGETAREADREGFPVARLVEELRGAGVEQREALRRYYVEGQPLEEVGRELRIGREQFLALRMRMRALVSRRPVGSAQGNRTRTAGAA